MALTTHVSQTDKTETPYQIDPEQTLRASQALLRHVQAEVKRLQENGPKRDLLAADDSDDEGTEDAQPIWLNLATKQYIADKHRLKPSKIPVPHSLNTDANATICLITTDPQRAVKNVVADPSFPSSLSSRITRIIGLSKLLVRYKSYEQKRQLLSEHDVFLADERIVNRLPKVLGKIFYKGTAKRPIPIKLAPGDATKEKGQKKLPKEERSAAVSGPAVVAKEIEEALRCIPVSLNPGYNIATRIGLDSFTSEQLKDNITAATKAIIAKHVVSGWRNVKSVHIKSPTSVALPIWLAEDLWVEKAEPTSKIELASAAALDADTESFDKKRKRKVQTTRGSQSGERKKARLAEEQAKDKEDTAARKARLTAQKASAFET